MTTPSLSRYFQSFTEEQEVRYTEESSHILHASDLFTACMREIYLLWQTGEKKTQSFPFDLWLKFNVGKHIEEQVKLKFQEKGILESGDVHLLNEEYGISFHPDARLKNNQLVEIKSKSADMFRLTKNFPLRKDQYQLELYLWADAAQTGILFVFTWDWKSKTSSRDHLIHYNMKSVEITKRTVASLREAEHGGPIPHRICQSKDEKRAIFCPMREQCFQLENYGLTKTIEDQLKER